MAVRLVGPATAPAPTLVDQLQAACAAHGERPAVRAGDTRLTFAQLWGRASVAAERLRSLGVDPSDRVVVRAPPAADSIVGMLATMLAGCTFVPIDPRYDKVRQRAIVRGSGAQLVLGELDPEVTAGSQVTESLDVSELTAGGDSRGAAVTHAAVRPDRAACLFFTSGSTGSPKGVPVRQDSLGNYTRWAKGELYDPTATPERLPALMAASLAFDHSVSVTWAALAAGHEIVLCADLGEFAVFLAGDERFAMGKLTPSHARLLEATEEPDYSATLVSLMFGGEALETALVERLRPRLRGVRVYNHYGPTETTVGCCRYLLDPERPFPTEFVPIGTPIDNTTLEIDERMRAQGGPEGQGELVVHGPGVGSGYWNHESDRFVVPDDGRPRSYRTGDLVHVVTGHAGEQLLYFDGRFDDELKVNGHRISVEELRAGLRASHRVDAFVVEVTRQVMDSLRITVVPASPADTDAARDEVVALAATLVPSAIPVQVDVTDRLQPDAHGKVRFGSTAH